MKKNDKTLKCSINRKLLKRFSVNRAKHSISWTHQPSPELKCVVFSSFYVRSHQIWWLTTSTLVLRILGLKCTVSKIIYTRRS